MSNSGNKTSKRPLPWILFILAFIGCLVLGYLWYSQSYSNGRSVKELNSELSFLLEKSNITKDSLQKELDLTIAFYEGKQAEMDALQIENQSLKNEVDAKKVSIRRLLSQGADPVALLRAKAEIERLKQEVYSYTSEIDYLTNRQDSLKKTTENITTRYEETSELLQKEKEESDELSNRLKTAKLQVGTLTVSPLRIKRGNKIPTSKASKVSEIKINVIFLENKLVEPGEKQISLRVLGTNNEVLGATNDDALIDSDQLISMQELMLFEGNARQLGFLYRQGAKYKKGQYTIEILSENGLLSRTNFRLE